MCSSILIGGNMNKKDLEYMSNFTRFRSTAVSQYKSPKEPVEIYKHIDAEFKRLRAAIKKGKITVGTYRIFKVRVINIDMINPENNIVEIATRSGMLIRISSDNFDAYSAWCNMSATEKVDSRSGYVSIGGRAYETYPIDGEGKRIDGPKRDPQGRFMGKYSD